MTSKSPEKSAIICGSVAYDTIMVFPDRFRHHILPDKLHMLNVAFLVPQMRREFGGCAGNIAYNLKLLGEVGYPMGGIGLDFGPYREWMQKVGISEKYLVTIPDEQIFDALLWTLARTKIVVEGAAAAPVAALLGGRVDAPQGSKVVAGLSGGNIDLDQLRGITWN